MTRILHLHMGMPKCGSSSLQAYLRAHREALAAGGVCYPDLAGKAIGNLTPFIMTLHGEQKQAVFKHNNPDYDPDAARPALVRFLETSEAPLTVLSSEGVSEMGKRANLDFIFESFDRVVGHIFYRPRVDWLLSHYTQAIKAGRYDTPLEDVLENTTFKTVTSQKMRFSGSLAFWQGKLGRDNVEVHFLSRSFPPPEEQFMSSLGVEMALPALEKGAANSSPTPFETCVLASAKRTSQKQFLKISRKIRRIAAPFDPFPKRSLLSEAILERINATFAEDTDRFLTLQDRISRADLEPDLSQKTAQAITFEEIRAHPAYAEVRAVLAKKKIELA
ncbi:hypothetical protein [Pseudooceanicola nanhaiensis]|uniref:hypothetical protein n=1 Tax=Pseudooceanicola nanhaiensis TaxID=375761 RepID=UPI001CD3E395|nr:hypothetical protein [Pseudooceanicola nanhaiensis]MCA0922776.1 hypothetical protein [Pseudooceanicola nanhaiensis]